MIESVMRQSMETWLKKECLDTGHKLADLGLLLTLIPDQLVHRDFDTAKFMLGKAEAELKQVSDRGLITSDVYHIALDNVRNLVKRYGTEVEPSPPFEKYNRFLDDFEARMFEKVVECQCGRPGGEIVAGVYVTITNPGDTVFSVGDVISDSAFVKENRRVKGLGKNPAEGDIK